MSENKDDIIDLDIVQPCYNPLPDWEKSVWLHFSDVKALLPGVSINLIIVNDGSKKNISNESIRFLEQRINHFQFISYEPNKGKGNALRTGIGASKGRIQIYTDIDFPYELIHIKEIYEMLVDGADVVSGIRKQNYYQTLSPMRWIASKMSQILNRLFLRLPFNDTQSGIKGINRKGKMVFMRTTIERYLADTEFLALAAKTRKLKLVPHEVSLREGIILSKMSFKTFIKELGNFIRVYSIVFKRKV
ncbi:MAG: glycosyltransferase family 2 protein [Bacteroidota bacterium]